ncbi:uncharacterized protein LOC105420191 [Amborella trichopoda]|uniref:uncharacterized protein LOC105420191 n=1 Tax=Amborella trichopoda TaxID=13333 RepID=UPI0005D3BAD9|nr:uncharacterized protein LOC105420191 [Amborella trichopoda]|eukprot:XP_011621156.1 uncharacterized protein LOC105420191 [Amborella trichopoda]
MYGGDDSENARITRFKYHLSREQGNDIKARPQVPDDVQALTVSMINEILVHVIEELGPQNIVYLVTDNRSNYVLAGDLIESRLSHIHKTWCATHGLNLLLEDIDKDIIWVQNVIKDAKLIVNFTYRYTIILDLMRKNTNGRELEKYGKTRFAINFLMIQTVSQVEEVLRVMVASSEWRAMNYSKSKHDTKLIE